MVGDAALPACYDVSRSWIAREPIPLPRPARGGGVPCREANEAIACEATGPGCCGISCLCWRFP